MDTLRMQERERGAASIALIIGIVAIIVMTGMTMLMLADSETKDSQNDRAGNEAYFVADSGRRIAERCLQLYMLGTVKQSLQKQSNFEMVGQIAAGNDPVQFLALGGIANETATTGLSMAHYRVDMSTALNTNNLVKDTGEAVWNNIAPPLSDEETALGVGSSERSFDAEVTVEKLDEPITTTDYWAFPLRFKITVRATAPIVGDFESTHVLVGRGTVTLYVRNAKDRSWADCLEYTESYTSSYNLNLPVMSNRDVYNGPVHTSGTFRFMDNPGTIFNGVVTTADDIALFWADGAWNASSKEYYPPDASTPNKYMVYPQFKAGYFLNVTSSKGLKTSNPDFAVKVVGDGVAPGATTEATINIYPTVDATNGVMLKGGIYVVGDCDIELVKDGTKQKYIFTHYSLAGSSKGQSIVTVDYDNNMTYVQRLEETTPTPFVGLPDVESSNAGSQNAIFVRGQVKSLKGNLALATQLSIMATGKPVEERVARGTAGNTDWNDITITGNLQYESLPDMATSPPNILGIFTESGDVAITSSASTVTIHAHIMTLQGEFYSTNFGGSMGALVLFGSIASKRAGAMGNKTAGYAKSYTWDTRATFAPPPLYLTESQQYSVTMERPDSEGNSTWRVVWASETH